MKLFINEKIMNAEETTRKILESLLDIPKGKVSTYKNIALKFGVHPRKVSQTMRYNKRPEIYPCYKVIATDGKVSGYSSKAGVSEKIQKLRDDGIEITDGKIDKKFII